MSIAPGGSACSPSLVALGFPAADRSRDKTSALPPNERVNPRLIFSRQLPAEADLPNDPESFPVDGSIKA
jgi:ABC-type hemin transport system substrate-binding protein